MAKKYTSLPALTALTALLLILFFSAPLQAQEGHPLVGTWQGEWDGNFLTLIMTWDGSTITGMANPGPTMTTLASVVLDSSTWSVTLTTDLKDDNGNTIHFNATATLDNIGSPVRALQGNWRTDTGNGSFTLTRQSGA